MKGDLTGDHHVTEIMLRGSIRRICAFAIRSSGKTGPIRTQTYSLETSLQDMPRVILTQTYKCKNCEIQQTPHLRATERKTSSPETRISIWKHCSMGGHVTSSQPPPSSPYPSIHDCVCTSVHACVSACMLVCWFVHRSSEYSN